MDQQLIEEMLEFIWTEREEGKDNWDHLQTAIHTCDIDGIKEDDDLTGILDIMLEKELIARQDDHVILTETGERDAENIIRRHRLAEVLFHDAMSLGHDQMEKTACSMEHILTREATDSICTFLGHPLACPHEKPIPRGQCCSVYSTTVKPLVTKLSHSDIEVDLKVVFVHSKQHVQTDRLLAFGIKPGKIIKIHQKEPSFIIQTGETELAIDKEIAKDIYVKKT